jgi:ATP-dependent Lhr-like helicase
MRRLELAGELTAGRFFAGINSLQFAAPEIERELEAAGDEGRVFWMNAADPASPAGLALDALDPMVPPRSAAARLCFRGEKLLAVSRRNGRDLWLSLAPGEDPPAAELIRFTTQPRRRAVSPARKILIETINGKAAGDSPWRELFVAGGFIPDRGKLILW